MKKITSVSPLLFEDYLVIALSAEWIKIFNKVPTFDIFIDKCQKLHLVSKEETNLAT